MSTQERKVVQAGRALARDRLAAYQRYAELVEAQEVALAAGDLEAFDTLSVTTQELQRTLGAATAHLNLADDPEAGGSSFVEQVTDLLRTTMARNDRIQARLSGLRHDAGQEIKKATENRPRVRSYINRSTSDEGPSLNVLL